MDLGILKAIGNTPMVEVSVGDTHLMAKLECMNPFGSMKDRAAKSTLLSLLCTNTINKDTTIVESSSGNFAIALSGVCSALGLKWFCQYHLTHFIRTRIMQRERYDHSRAFFGLPEADHRWRCRFFCWPSNS